MPEGLDRIFFVSGGSEAVGILHQAGAAMGGGDRPGEALEGDRRMPSYHGGTLGALAVTGDGALTETFADRCG